MEKVLQTIRIEGRTVSLTTDGRLLAKTFDSEVDAVACYERFKGLIQDGAGS